MLLCVVIWSLTPTFWFLFRNLKESYLERGAHVNEPSANQFLISEPKEQLNCTTKEVLKTVQASFNFLWVLHKSFQFWKKSLFENSMWAAGNIRTTNSRRSSSAAHLGFSNRYFFRYCKFWWRCYPNLNKGCLHNFSGFRHCVISQLLCFKTQKLFRAWFVYMHTTLFKRLSTLDLYCFSILERSNIMFLRKF